ncbi:hypothetical protein IMZ08_13945 [Bacillus luteolus]|uniref:NADH dehydrogenase subunit 6 n=1 Tax=Litchfieldia luteola TaxID=682179 RepID=A0ABR9QLU4_9BACI|nr:hypothetical protein [Cytobacillus luteolus]MBE4909164.1 hypothetical protein [Cytobacillus luteolus]MBP1940383.1 cation transport ATPase [Cytobacillus luteolus]
MSAFIISMVLLLLFVSPFIFYRLGKKRMAYVNLFVVTLYLLSWLHVLFAGIPYGLNLSTVVWVIALALSLLFLVLSGVHVFYKIYPGFNKYALSIVFLITIGISLFIFMNFYSDKGVNSILDITMIYTVPLFLASLLVIGTTQLNIEKNNTL